MSAEQATDKKTIHEFCTELPSAPFKLPMGSFLSLEVFLWVPPCKLTAGTSRIVRGFASKLQVQVTDLLAQRWLLAVVPAR